MGWRTGTPVAPAERRAGCTRACHGRAAASPSVSERARSGVSGASRTVADPPGASSGANSTHRTATLQAGPPVGARWPISHIGRSRPSPANGTRRAPSWCGGRADPYGRRHRHAAALTCDHSTAQPHFVSIGPAVGSASLPRPPPIRSRPCAPLRRSRPADHDGPRRDAIRPGRQGRQRGERCRPRRI